MGVSRSLSEEAASDSSSERVSLLEHVYRQLEPNESVYGKCGRCGREHTLHPWHHHRHCRRCGAAFSGSVAPGPAISFSVTKAWRQSARVWVVSLVAGKIPT